MSEPEQEWPAPEYRELGGNWVAWFPEPMPRLSDREGWKPCVPIPCDQDEPVKLDLQPAATELQSLLGVPDADEGHGVRLPEG